MASAFGGREFTEKRWPMSAAPLAEYHANLMPNSTSKILLEVALPWPGVCHECVYYPANLMRKPPERAASMGFGLRTSGYSILSFARYVDALNSKSQLLWKLWRLARQDKGNTGKPSTWARRLKICARFAVTYNNLNPVPRCRTTTIFGRIGQRLARHIYSEQEITDYWQQPINGFFIPGLRGATYETLFVNRFHRPSNFRSLAFAGHGRQSKVGHVDHTAKPNLPNHVMCCSHPSTIDATATLSSSTNSISK